MFQIVLHIDDIKVLYTIKNKLGEEQVRKNGENSALFIVLNLSEIKENLLPIFEQFPILTTKALDLADFITAIKIKLESPTEKLISIDFLKNSFFKKRYE
jgi:hypothetical protein